MRAAAVKERFDVSHDGLLSFVMITKLPMMDLHEALPHRDSLGKHMAAFVVCHAHR